MPGTDKHSLISGRWEFPAETNEVVNNGSIQEAGLAVVEFCPPCSGTMCRSCGFTPFYHRLLFTVLSSSSASHRNARGRPVT